MALSLELIGQGAATTNCVECEHRWTVRMKFHGRPFFSQPAEQLYRRMLKKFVQQGRRRVETGGVPSGYVEDFDELRTSLADFQHPAKDDVRAAAQPFLTHSIGKRPMISLVSWVQPNEPNKPNKLF